MGGFDAVSYAIKPVARASSDPAWLPSTRGIRTRTREDKGTEQAACAASGPFSLMAWTCWPADVVPGGTCKLPLVTNIGESIGEEQGS